MKIKYIGPEMVALKKDKTYEVLDEKHGTYKIMSELEETYYFPKRYFKIVEK